MHYMFVDCKFLTVLILVQLFRSSTGTGTKFGGYLSSSPTFLKYQMDMYWPIMKIKVTNYISLLKYQMDMYWLIMKIKVTNNDYSLH